MDGAGCPIRQPGPLFVAKLFNADNPQILTKAVLSNVMPPHDHVPLIQLHLTCALPIKLCWQKFKTNVPNIQAHANSQVAMIISSLANFLILFGNNVLIFHHITYIPVLNLRFSH